MSRLPSWLLWSQEEVAEHHQNVSIGKGRREVGTQPYDIVDQENSLAALELSSPPVLVFPAHDFDYIS